MWNPLSMYALGFLASVELGIVLSRASSQSRTLGLGLGVILGGLLGGLPFFGASIEPSSVNSQLAVLASVAILLSARRADYQVSATHLLAPTILGAFAFGIASFAYELLVGGSSEARVWTQILWVITAVFLAPSDIWNKGFLKSYRSLIPMEHPEAINKPDMGLSISAKPVESFSAMGQALFTAFCIIFVGEGLLTLLTYFKSLPQELADLPVWLLPWLAIIAVWVMGRQVIEIRCQSLGLFAALLTMWLFCVGVGSVPMDSLSGISYFIGQAILALILFSVLKLPVESAPLLALSLAGLPWLAIAIPIAKGQYTLAWSIAMVLPMVMVFSFLQPW